MHNLHHMAAPPCAKRTKVILFNDVKDAVQTRCAQWRILLDVWTSEGNPNTIAVAKRLLVCSRALQVLFVGDDANDPDPIMRLQVPVRILPADPENIYFLKKAVAALGRRCTALEAHLEGALAQGDSASEEEQARLVDKIIHASKHMMRRQAEAKVALRRAREERDRGTVEQLRLSRPSSGRYAAQIEAVERRLEAMESEGLAGGAAG